MGRGRGKSKKQNVVTAHDELGSRNEQKLPTSKRRARTQKLLKDEVAEDVVIEKLNIDCDIKTSKDEIVEENGTRKRKSVLQVKENSDPAGTENGPGAKSSPESPTKVAGFRQIGSRRKSTPRRAAEVGVECS